MALASPHREECSHGECDRPRRTAGLCGMHYLRKWKHGSPDIRLSAANGEGGVNGDGYRMVTANGRRVYEHVHICEQAIGRPLPKGAQVHHVNEVKGDNRLENFVVCPSAEYHRLLHARTEAYEATGDANMRQCRYCRAWDSPENLYIPPTNNFKGHHLQCRRAHRRANGNG